MTTHDRARREVVRLLNLEPQEAYEAFQSLEPKLQAFIVAHARPISPPPVLTLEETCGVLCDRLADVRDAPDPVKIRALLSRPSR